MGKIKSSDLGMAEILAWTTDLEVVGYMSLKFKRDSEAKDVDLEVIYMVYLKPQDLTGSPRKRESTEEDQRLNALAPNIRQNVENPAKEDFKVVASQVGESFHVFKACNVQGQDWFIFVSPSTGIGLQ